jgi:ketosteroid isomerase-like protein
MRLLTALLIGGCLTATGALAQSKTEMQQVLDDWAAAFNKEDAGKVAMHYKSDATLFPSGNDMLQGRRNVAKPDEGIKIREPVASKIRHLSVPQTGSYVMSDASSARSSQQSEGNLPLGHGWLAIIKRPTPEAFAAAFTKDVVLDASVLPRSIISATDVRAFFGATPGDVRCHRFQARGDRGIANLSRVGRDIPGRQHRWPDRADEGCRRTYREYPCVLPAFSADLAGRLAGNMTVDPFLGSTLRGHP